MQIQQPTQERKPVCYHIITPLEGMGGICKSEKQNDSLHYNSHCCLEPKSCSVYMLRELVKRKLEEKDKIK